MKIDGKHKVIVMAPDKVVIDTTGNITIHGGVSVGVEGGMAHFDDVKIKADNLKIGNEPKTGAGNE
jgi:hypothetical protein